MEMPARGTGASGIEDMLHKDDGAPRLSQITISETGARLWQDPGASGP